MKITCSKEQLLQGLEMVQVAISTKSTLPILSNFLVETQKTKIILTSTDLEVGIRTSLPCQVLTEGSTTIPARRFVEIVRELPEDKVEITIDKENRASITCGKARFLINGLPKEDYPILPEFKEDLAFNLPKELVQRMLKKTSFAVSTDETRYVLNGVFLTINDKEVKMVATDGRRLAYINETAHPSASHKAIIPTKAVNELMHLLANSKEEAVKISIAENQIGFKFDETVLISRLVEGSFPNYEQVIPKSFGIQLKLRTKEFLQATKRVSLLATEKGGSVKYSLKQNVLKISTTMPGVGEAEEEMVVTYKDNPLEIAFNPGYVLDALKVIDSEEVYFELTAPLNPGVLRPSSNEKYIYVLMPMRVE